MAVPRAQTIPAGGAQYRKKKRVRYDLVVALLVIVGMCLVVNIVRPTQQIVKEQDLAQEPIQQNEDNQPIETVDSELLEHEQFFLDTIKSCMPGADQNCGEFIPETKQRIALLQPPGEMSNMLWKWVQQVVKKHEASLVTNAKHPIEFIRTSHVPPYGYGKTHGLTKVIRIVPKPLVLGVSDALQALVIEGERNHHNKPDEPNVLQQQDITIKDLKAVLRQFMRFHCRLSKLAAHTAILSVNLDDYIDNYDEATNRLYEFIMHSDDSGSNNNQNGFEDIQGEMMMMDGGMNDINMLSSELSFVKNILTRIQTTMGGNAKVLNVLDKVLLEELRNTKNLTHWPCESFWTVGEPGERTKLSPFATKLARSFSPNCTAPFASCWVHRDKCEFVGDGACKEKK